MPELPEVETVVRALRPVLLGRTITYSRLLGKVRKPYNAAHATSVLSGKTFRDVRRRAKYLVFDMEDGVVILAHLGMTGYFHITPAAIPENIHDRIVFGMDNGEELRFADARRFGFIELTSVVSPDAWPAELSSLGPEPLGRQCTGAYLLGRARHRKTPVKVFIMDHEVVVGVGNIYASEALFAAGIDPGRPAGSLTVDEWNRLIAAIRAVLRSAIQKGGSTIRNYRGVDGSEGHFQRKLKVYGRKGETCPRCGTMISTARLGGRSTFHCPNCQK